MSTERMRAQNLVGRDEDLAKLVDVIEGTDEVARGAIVVCGARGIGRSSLVTAAVGRLDLEPVRMLGVLCQATSTYASLVHSLSGAAGHLAFGPLVPRWLDIIAAAGTTASHIVARRMLASMPDRSTRPPLVLVIDDAHFFDRHSQEVVAYLAHHGAGFGLRSVLTVDDAAPLDAFASLERLRLRPLDVAEVRALLESATEQPLPHRVARQLHRWTGGNPALVLDLSRQLTAAELAGTGPIGLPLVPSDALVRRLGGRVQALDDHERCCLAVFAQCPSLRWEMLPRVGGCSSTLVDGLVSDGWLAVHHRTVEPRRRADALVAWAGLAPSLQHELNVRLATELRETSPATADYFAAHSGDAAAADRLVSRTRELYDAGEPDLAAAVSALALHRDNTLHGSGLVLGQLLVADGYVVAGREELTHPQRQREQSGSELLIRLAELATMTADPSEVMGHVDVGKPPLDDLDPWLQAILMVCRLQLALDGPDESSRLTTAIQPLLHRASVETRALAALVAAERATYSEEPESPAALGAALDAWLAVHPGGFDLGTVTAAVDLLGLGKIGAARDLLASVGSLQQLPFATSRAALLTLRVEAEVAHGHYRRAAASLVALDRERPSLSGGDLITTSQAIRISTVCDDVDECRAIELRLSRSAGAVLTYPARQAHTAALGFRELVLGNYGSSRELLNLALQGPALLLQGRSCALADLVEATVADGDRDEAAELLERHSQWLPDRDGDRSRALLARCRALVAGREDVDRLFHKALVLLSPIHETDRARTLLAYGRTLILLGQEERARHLLVEARGLFAQAQLPGWERHVRRLQALCPQPSEEVQPPDSQLNEIEQQILALVLQRKRNREIAASLFVSLRTVESHLTRIFRKLGVSTKSQLFRQLSTAPAQEEIRIISRNSAETARNRR